MILPSRCITQVEDSLTLSKWEYKIENSDNWKMKNAQPYCLWVCEEARGHYYLFP